MLLYHSRLQLANLYRVVSGCAHDKATMPGLLDALLKPEAFSAQLDAMAKSAQLWIVHNSMDLGSVDAEVRPAPPLQYRDDPLTSPLCMCSGRFQVVFATLCLCVLLLTCAALVSVPHHDAQHW
jgi:hypothetical protein